MTLFLERSGKPSLAYDFLSVAGDEQSLPVLMFLHGFMSDRKGTKAEYLMEQCRKRGQAFLAFDCSGHGESEGTIAEGTIGEWKNEVLDIIDSIVPDQPLILAGSSFGGWLSLLVAQERPEQIKGVVGIAAAPDFTVRLYTQELTDVQREAVETKGRVEIEHGYPNSPPYVFTKQLFDEADAHLFFDGKIHHFAMPLHLIQGGQDKSVPADTPERLKASAPDSDIKIIMIPDGDHSLSRCEPDGPDDLAIIDQSVQELSL